MLAAGARGGEVPWLAESPSSEPSPPRIEWLGTWQETYSANVKRWSEELGVGGGSSRDARHRLLRARQSYLVEAMIERFQPSGQERVAAYELAASLLEGVDRGRAHAYRRRVLEEFPGELSAAAAALRGMIDSASLAEDGELIEYAAERLLALNAVGTLPDTHEWVADALKKRLELRAWAGRLAEARADLEALARHLPAEDAWLKSMEAELLYLGGRAEWARGIAEALPASLRASSSHRERRDLYAKAVEQLTEPVFPRRMELEARWAFVASHAGGPQAELIDDLLAGLTGAAAMIERGQRLYGPIWLAIREFLGTPQGEPAAALARLQDRKAAEESDALARPSEGDKILAAFRRFPYSAAVHRAMLAAAERMLRDGQGGLAQRTFQDVLDRSADADLAARARSGLWLAMAQAPARGARGPLAAAVELAPPDAKLPWMGRLLPAADVGLLVGGLPAPPSPSPPLSRLGQVALETPEAPAWAPGQLYGVPGEVLASAWYAHGRVVAAGEGVLLTGPNLLAWYAPGQSRPRWVRTAHVPGVWVGGWDGGDERGVVIPGPTVPAVGHGAVYCRWGLDRQEGRPSCLAAFDLAGGAMRWSTAGEAFWREMQPISDPAAADGRLYVLAARTDVRINAPVYLACVRASDGAGLWRRLLAHQTVGLRSPRRGAFHNRLACPMEYGSAVAVEGGQVYCSTAAGFVACCDARDGMVEWVRSYPQATAGQDLPELVRRQGGPPIVAADRVIFTPRDCLGAFALDRHTGRLLWDNPFVPSGGAVALPDGRPLMHDGRLLALVDPNTGRATWLRRLDQEIVGPPVPAGDCVYVGTRAGLVRLSAATGSPAERAAWESGAFHNFALVGRSITGVSVRSRAAAAGGAEGLAPRQEQEFRLPLAESCRLDRPGPRFYLPPDSPPSGPRLAYIHSAGLLECLELAPRRAFRWRVLIEPGFRDLIQHEDLLVLAYPGELVALAAADGALRWRCPAPASSHRHQQFGRYLVLWPADDDTRLAVADLSSGRALWHRKLTEDLPGTVSPIVRAAGWDGRNLNVFVQSQWGRGRSYVRICRPEDGTIVGSVLLPDNVNGKRPAAHMAGGFAWYFGADGRVHEVQLDGARPPRTYPHELPNGDHYADWQAVRTEVFGPWICLRYAQQGGYDARRTYVLSRQDPGYLLTLRRHGTVRGDLLYDAGSDTLSIVDLAARKEAVRCQIPGVYGDAAAILDYRQTPESIFTVAFARIGRYGDVMLRADRFDRAGGQHVDAQVLGVRYWSDFSHDHYRGRRMAQFAPQVLWDGAGFFLAEPQGLRAFASSPAPDTPAVCAAQPAPQPVEIDGDLAEWEAASALSLAGRDADGRILLSHDDANLYVAVDCADADGRPRLGRGNYGGGDFLELSFQSDRADLRLLVGQDDGARPRVEAFPSGRLVDDVRAAVRHDPATGRMVYELAAPLDRVASGEGSRQWVRLAAAVWDDRPPSGPVPVARFGGGLVGADVDGSRHELIRPAPLLRRHEQACLSIARVAPTLPESLAFLREYGRVRVPAPLTCWQGYGELLAAHARSPAALPLLAVLDQVLREQLTDDPRPAVLAAAQAAGVPEDVRQRYLAAASSYLSFWARTEGFNKGNMAMVQLYDGGAGARGWDHRVFWGADRHDGGATDTPSRRRAGTYLGPDRQWAELRVPLIWLDMQDKPIHGVSLVFGADGNVDRLAVGREGKKEQVLLDDDFPPGAKVTGAWEWQSGLAHSGKRSLGRRGTSPRNRTQEFLLSEPVTLHLEGLPDPEGALDKPRAIAALREHIPSLGGSEHSWRFFEALLRLEAGEDLDRRMALYEWYLASHGDSPRAVEMLLNLRQYYADRNVPGWEGKLDGFLRAHGFRPEVEYHFRTRHLRDEAAFLRNWQVIGPFEARMEADGKVHPIETEPIDLARPYPTGKGPVRWRPLESKQVLVDLDALFSHPDFVFAYAVCWARVEKDTPAVLEFGVDDAGKVWVNRKQAISYRGGAAAPRSASARIALQAGWNEILVKISDDSASWKFCLELFGPEGRGLPEGVRLSTTPPPAGG